MADYARPANEPMAMALAQAEAGSAAARGALQRMQAAPRDMAARSAAFPADRATKLAEAARLR